MTMDNVCRFALREQEIALRSRKPVQAADPKAYAARRRSRLMSSWTLTPIYREEPDPEYDY